MYAPNVMNILWYFMNFYDILLEAQSKGKLSVVHALFKDTDSTPKGCLVVTVHQQYCLKYLILSEICMFIYM